MIFGIKKTITQPLFLKNTMSGEKEVFNPLNSGEVRMYNCGPTVYSEQHIGNMRAAFFADTLRRVLEYNGYSVKQVINITDVGHLTSDDDEGEDKIEKKARESDKKASEIAKEITEIYLSDLSDIGVDISKIRFPRATEYIDNQIEMIKTLLEKGYAYIIDRGVAFDTSKFDDYGKLGNINIEELKQGARVEIDAQKRNPSDFWLWKFSDKNEKRQQEWNSPWGIGFPGWHIECSAMSRALLGQQIDIHTGGVEHIPVHHNNEIAQSEAVSGKTFANYWLHNSHLLLDGKKISKSIGNVIYIRDIKNKGFNPISLRYLFLNAKYDSEQNFTWDALKASEKSLNKIYAYYTHNLTKTKHGKVNEKYKKAFTHSINDNINTPAALAILWELIKDASIKPEDKKATILDFDIVFGLNISSHKLNELDFDAHSDMLPEKIRNILKEREKARVARDWKTSDELRNKMLSLGYKIIDKDGQQILKKYTD